MDHNFNRLLTSATIYSRMIYVLYCSSHIGVSVHKAKISEFRLRKGVQGFWQLRSQFPTPHYWIPFHTFCTAQTSLHHRF